MLFSTELLVLNGFFGGLSAASSVQTVVAVAISHRGSYLEELPPVATTALARVRFSLGGNRAAAPLPLAGP